MADHEATNGRAPTTPSADGSNSAPLLDVRDLRTYFLTDQGDVRAVDGISFTMNKSERLGVVGESGSGKSVTAASIMRLIDPPGAIVGGQVLFHDRDLLQLAERDMRKIRGKEIAIIFQDPMTALDPVFTVGSQMVETLKIHRGMSKKEARIVAIDTLADVAIPRPDQRLDDYPHQFSGGMRQRVVIAMALLCDPDLLIADEPTTALDVTSQAQVIDLMLGLANDRGTAVMLITHDLGVVAGFCESVQVMYSGEIIERGPAGSLYLDPQHPYTRGLLESVPRLDGDAQHQLHSIRGTAPSPTTPPSGCRFSPRCDFATELCVSHRPEPCDGHGESECACHFAGRLQLQSDGAGT